MAYLRTITGFKEKLAGGGARSNLFEVDIPAFPSNISTYWNSETRSRFNFLCKSAALPSSNISPIQVPYRNRILKVQGQRTFDPWTVSVINDENFDLRTAFEQWVNQMDKLSNATGATSPESYMTEIYVHQIGKGADQNRESIAPSTSLNETTITPLRTYKLYGAFPTNVSAIELSYDTADAIEEFSVEFQYQYFTIGDTPDQTNVLIA